jgi:hypothetical protein
MLDQNLHFLRTTFSIHHSHPIALTRGLDFDFITRQTKQSSNLGAIK